MTDITPMKLNHMSIPSSDVSATATFFEQHLGCTVTGRHGSWILKRPGFDIVIDDAGDRPVAWPHNFHIGFELGTLDDVRALYDRMATAGVVMKTGVFKHERGSRFFCEVPGGVLVEINTRSDAEEQYRGTFDL
ncbi:VOC family protein [Paraburkholderia bryophila]|uniref:VOC family protein n=1 Tax=Paraburkholderia bryophila TaxID=420952 RepID=UPI00234A6984|nr:VOC family protein [Paraburkholderia bryophila]WCM23698.1 VOC family protein [Paraburkholderia bryophila]